MKLLTIPFEWLGELRQLMRHMFTLVTMYRWNLLRSLVSGYIISVPILKVESSRIGTMSFTIAYADFHNLGLSLYHSPQNQCLPIDEIGEKTHLLPAKIIDWGSMGKFRGHCLFLGLAKHSRHHTFTIDLGYLPSSSHPEF